MKKLLVVVDYQKDFVDGALGFPDAVSIEEGIAKTVQHYLAAGDEVLFTFDTHGENYLNTREGQALPVLHCLDGSEAGSFTAWCRRSAGKPVPIISCIR